MTSEDPKTTTGGWCRPEMLSTFLAYLAGMAGSAALDAGVSRAEFKRIAGNLADAALRAFDLLEAKRHAK